MTKEWIREHLEQDWDDENVYYSVSEEGRITKYNLATDQTIEYMIDRVEH